MADGRHAVEWDVLMAHATEVVYGWSGVCSRALCGRCGGRSARAGASRAKKKIKRKVRKVNRLGVSES